MSRIAHCTCFEEHYAVVIEHLGDALGHLPFLYCHYDDFKRIIQEQMDAVHTDWRCINNCWDVDGVITDV